MSLSNPVATTTLEAVNILLESIGEAPINSLSADNIVDATIAKQVLEEVSKDVQTEGWLFNTETEFQLALDGNGWITVPTNCLSVDANRTHHPLADVTQRGNRMYDRYNHTYVFTAAMYVDIIIGLGFEDVPESCRRYITTRAVRVFSNRLVSSGDLHSFATIEENRARATLVATQTDNADSTMFDSGDAIAVLLRR